MAKSLPLIALNLGQATISVQNNPVTSAVKANHTFRYSVKLMNSNKKSEYMVLSVGFSGRFADPEAIKAKLHEAHPEMIASSTKDVGYIQPGHGCRGRQRWIITEEDVQEMYRDYYGKGEILLWCYMSNKKEAEDANRATCTPPSKRSRSVSKSTPTESVAQKLTEVDEIVSELQDHSSGYSPEQIRAWAHLIHMKKHDSYLVPPSKPFFQGRKSSAVTVSSTHSPGKKIGLRSECIDQLKKWHELLECGAITQAQYEELQKSILGDINEL